MQSFAEYEAEKWKWITAIDTNFYPDHFPAALKLYKPVIDRFRELASEAPSSIELLRTIQKTGGKITNLRRASSAGLRAPLQAMSFRGWARGMQEGTYNSATSSTAMSTSAQRISL